MTPSPELAAARDLLYQGIGRNVILFQRLEHLLKLLLSVYQGSYSAPTMADYIKRGQKAVEKKTLGLLAGDLFSELILKPSDDSEPDLDGLDPEKFSLRFGLTVETEIHDEWQSRLKRLVDQRNDLVHLSYLTWDFETTGGCDAAIKELDEQRERVVEEIKRAKYFIQAFAQCVNSMRDSLSDPEVQKVPDNGA